jgi:hypothetical protein
MFAGGFISTAKYTHAFCQSWSSIIEKLIDQSTMSTPGLFFEAIILQNLIQAPYNCGAINQQCRIKIMHYLRSDDSTLSIDHLAII